MAARLSDPLHTSAALARARRRRHVVSVLAAAAVPAMLWPLTSSAQQPAAPPPSMPGLVITTTPPPQPSGPPSGMPGLVIAPSGPSPFPGPAAPPGGPPQAPAATVAKPKPKPAPRPAAAKPPEPVAHSIAALVNDEPITGFAVDLRARFMSLSGNFQDRARANLKSIAENPATGERLKAILNEVIQANPGKSREDIIRIFEERKKVYVTGLQQQAVSSAKASLVPTFRKKALDELVEERLKLQEAKRLSVNIPDDEVARAFKGVAERNKMTPDQFVQMIRQQGADADVMKERIKVQMAWRETVRKRYGHQVSVSGRDIDKLVAAAAPGEDLVELQLHKITFALPAKIDQKQMAQRLDDAEALRRRFGGCKGTSALVKDQQGAKFEDLGYRKAATIPEPTRSLLVGSGDGQMAPAALAGAGVELYAVCARRTQKASDEKRQQVENELQLKEFERLAQRYMADLKRDGRIDIK